MNTKDFKSGMVVKHGAIIGTIKEICDNYVIFTSGYVCHIDYIEYYDCAENEYESVCGSICRELGKKNIFSCLCRFDWFVLFMKTLGYEYTKADDESESHIFRNSRKDRELLVHPVCYYPNQGLFRICNITVV